MVILLLTLTVWTLMFTLAITRVSSINMRSTWQVGLFFLIAPLLNIIVLVGWGMTGWMSEDWENLM